MTSNTENAIRSVCAMDATINAATVDKALDLLRHGDATAEADTPLTATEAAAMLRCTTRTVTRYGNLGLIRRIGGKGDGTLAKYSRRSVEAYLAGRTAA